MLPPDAAAKPSVPATLQNQLETVRALYESDKHLASARALSTLQQTITTYLTSDSTSQKAQAQSIQAALESPPYPKILRELAEVQHLRTALHTKDASWTLSYSSAQTRVWYRREPNTATHSILTEGEIRAPLVNVAALIYEADLYEQLFWYVTAARAVPVRNATWLKRAAHIATYVPWPLYRRDVVVYAFGVDGMDEQDGCVMVVSRSLRDDDEVDHSEVAPAPRTVRVDMHNSGFELVPISPGVVKAKVLVNVDPHLSFVPIALINWIARMFCRWSLRTLEARAKELTKMPQEYQTRIKTEPMYAYIRRRLGEYWATKGFSVEDSERAENNAAVGQERLSDNFDPDVTPSGPPASVMKQLLRGDPEAANQTSTARTSLSRFFLSSVML